MDVNSIRTKYQNLKNEVISKGKPLQKFDGTDSDIYPEKGDVFVKDQQVAGDNGKPLTYSGNVRSDSGGNITRVDIEETTPDGNKNRYVYDKGSIGETLTKKTDTEKVKVDISLEPDSTMKAHIEETTFVEAALNPEIDGKSEKLKGSILDAAYSVELLDGSDQDMDKNPGVIKLENARVFSVGGSNRSFSGSVVKDKSGKGFEKIELTENKGEANETEYYFTKTNNYDYYKKSTADSSQSSQVFEEGGPKLVLYQEENEAVISEQEQ